MTKKEKARGLVDKFKELYDYGSLSKYCALTTVDEIIEALEFHSWQNRKWLEYYEEVKQEIEKL